MSASVERSRDRRETRAEWRTGHCEGHLVKVEESKSVACFMRACKSRNLAGSRGTHANGVFLPGGRRLFGGSAAFLSDDILTATSSTAISFSLGGLEFRILSSWILGFLDSSHRYSTSKMMMQSIDHHMSSCVGQLAEGTELAQGWGRLNAASTTDSMSREPGAERKQKGSEGASNCQKMEGVGREDKAVSTDVGSHPRSCPVFRAIHGRGYG